MDITCEWGDWPNHDECTRLATHTIQYGDITQIGTGPSYRPDGHVVDLSVCMVHMWASMTEWAIAEETDSAGNSPTMVVFRINR